MTSRFKPFRLIRRDVPLSYLPLFSNGPICPFGTTHYSFPVCVYPYPLLCCFGSTLHDCLTSAPCTSGPTSRRTPGQEIRLPRTRSIFMFFRVKCITMVDPLGDRLGTRLALHCAFLSRGPRWTAPACPLRQHSAATMVSGCAWLRFEAVQPLRHSLRAASALQTHR